MLISDWSSDVCSSDLILRWAEEIDADLIVVGPHRRQFRDAFIGTTAERTIAHSQRPVLMAAGVPSGPYDRALIALDLNDDSRSIALSVQQMGILGRAEIVAMHVFDAPAHGMMKRAMQEREAIDHYLANEERRAEDEFRTLMAEVGLRPARRRLWPVNGTVARSILECGREEEADVVVVGTSERRGMERLKIGRAHD